MPESLTITQLDPAAAEWIEQEAERTGLPIEAVARQLIYRGLELERRHEWQQRYDDLNLLAGTWSAEEAEEFRQATAELDKIDDHLWR